MRNNSADTTGVRGCLARFLEGDTSALNELIALASNRLQLLARRMLRDYPRVKRWAQTDDVLQNALIRLCRALEQVRPETVRDFYGLATTQIRRELLDLARHFGGPQGAAAHHKSWPAPADSEQANLTHDPAGFIDWGEFHEQIAGLPDDQREVFGLIYYQGLTQDNAAEVLGVAVRTIQRRWQNALLTLHRARNGEPPGV